MCQQDILNSGYVLVAIGFILVLIGMITSSLSGSADFGGVILIGPIPLAFGSSPEITSSMFWVGVFLAVVYFIVRRKL